MLKTRLADDKVFKRFFQRKFLSYIIPNVFFNTCVPYFAFRHMNTVYLFEGEICFARFLLPMAFFLPFIITFDLLKKTAALSEHEQLTFLLPGQVNSNGFLFKTAGLNGCIGLFIVGFSTWFVQLVIPQGYGFDGTGLSVVLGITAAILTVIFTWLPINRILTKSTLRLRK